MSRFYRFIGIFLLVVVVIVAGVFLPGCKPEEVTENVSLAAAITKAEQTQDKKINSTLGLSVVIYDVQGNPMRITQEIAIERVQKEGDILIKGTIGTSEFKLSTALKAIVDMALTRA